MRVLLTGGSGFLAFHCIVSLLEHGHYVVFTVRSANKGQNVLLSLPEAFHERTSYFIVKDIAAKSAFDEVLKVDPPFDAVVHTASPFHVNIKDPDELLQPAIEGTTGILEALKRLAPSVKRVVITSSFAAILSSATHPATYDETCWNPITEDEAKENPANAYRASKTFAEKAAWEFLKQETPHFDIVTINPPLVLGPVAPHLESLEDVNTSNVRIRNMVQGKCRDRLPPSLGVYIWADVRDVALAHLRALETPEAGNKRFLIAADDYMTNADIAKVIVHEFPELSNEFPTNLESDLPQDVYGFNNSRSKDILKLQYRRLYVTVVDTVKSLRAVGT